MRSKMKVALTVGLLFGGLAWATAAQAGRGGGPIIYVTGQGLFYDSIVLADLPPNGPFQELQVGGPSPNGLQTEFGPGDTGYLGRRWWLDANGSGVMDEGDKYFSCPLLGPGRENP